MYLGLVGNLQKNSTVTFAMVYYLQLHNKLPGDSIITTHITSNVKLGNNHFIKAIREKISKAELFVVRGSYSILNYIYGTWYI